MSSAGIFGGNFDPVHNGHLITAQKILELRKLDKIIFVPAFISPFKQNKISSSPLHRVNMLKTAIGDKHQFELCDIEIKSEGVSYSIDTLRKLKNNYDRIDLIIGYDNIVDFPQWKEPDEIIKIATPVVLRRVHDIKGKKNRFFDKAVFADTPLIEISSTEIRVRVKKNLSIDFLVPEKVKEYIYKNNLYKE